MPEILYKTGVYCIINKVNGRLYIGSTAARRGFDKRWADHRDSLKKGNHPNQYLQSSWNRHGEQSFKFQVLCRCPPKFCIGVEQRYLDIFQTYKRDLGYNIRSKADNNLGVKFSAESRERCSRAALNRSDEIKQKMRDILIKAGTGRRLSDKIRKKISNTLNRPEVRAKMVAARLGSRHSTETREKMSASHKLVDPEINRRIGRMNRGIKRTPETRAKMSASLRAAHKRRRLLWYGIQ